MKKFSTVLLAGSLILALAGKDTLKTTVNAPANALVKLGTPIVFTATLAGDDGKPKAGEKINYSIYGSTEACRNGSGVTDRNGRIRVETKLTKPGFVRIEFHHWGSKPKLTAWNGAGSGWEQIGPGLPCPKDFESYWKKQTDEMKKMPLNEKVIPVPKMSKPGIKVFDVTCDAPGERPVRGYYSVPADAKKGECPAIIVFHGAGVHDSYNPSHLTKAYHAIAMDINAHGLDNGLGAAYYKKLESGSMAGYRFWNADSRDKNHFRNMYRRLYRAMQFLKSRPEWDGKILVSTGTSQGGGQAVAAAGLDPDVTCLVAHVPALCDMAGRKSGHDNGWPGLHNNWTKQRYDLEKAYVEMSYMDGVHFAKFVNPEAEVYLSAGINDPACGAACVSAVYNTLKVRHKQIRISPGYGHNVNPVARKEADAMIRHHIESVHPKKAK